jgi:hypothetical protein
MTFTVHERLAIEAAAQAWARAYRWMMAPRGLVDAKLHFEGPNADDELRARGINIDYRRGDVTYGAVEKEVRRLGKRLANAKRRSTHPQGNRRKLTPEHATLAREMADGGARTADIARRLGCCSVSVYRMLKRSAA